MIEYEYALKLTIVSERPLTDEERNKRIIANLEQVLKVRKARQ